MKRIQGTLMALSLVVALTVIAQEVKPGKVEAIDLGKGVKLDLVLIPAGKFKMGGPGKDHEIKLTKPFYIGKHEITQEQWEAVMGNNPSSRTKGAKFPVTDVSWEDCQKFIKKLNAKTSGGYRLPTEAEWEYSCRAGTTTAYSFDDEITPKDANYEDSKIGKPVEVGSYKPNAFGLHDMHGNVSEWCDDLYGEYPFAVTDPKGPATGERRVLRGGSFYGYASDASSSNRYDSWPTYRYNSVGLRLVRNVDHKAEVTPTVPKSYNEAKEVQKAVAKSLQKEAKPGKVEIIDLSKDVKLEMVLIPAGKVTMGSPASEKRLLYIETQHEVTLTKPFYIGKHEITQEQWEAVMGNNPSSRTKGAKFPVTDVSWEDCQKFIKKLNAKTSGGYRLPTEAEWEYSCRAGTTTEYSYGASLTKADANIEGGSIKEVGSYVPNAFGLYDMHGNVWEWCEDLYGDYPAGAVIDPKGPAMGEDRVRRGGSFSDSDSVACSSFRLNGTPSNRTGASGFRLARTP